MNIKSETQNEVLTVSLSGELDHHGAYEVRKSIDAVIDDKRPSKLLLRLDKVHFCDSSGLGLIMGRYRKMSELGAEMAVLQPSAAVERIIKLAGLDKLIKIERSNNK